MAGERGQDEGLGCGGANAREVSDAGRAVTSGVLAVTVAAGVEEQAPPCTAPVRGGPACVERARSLTGTGPRAWSSSQTDCSDQPGGNTLSCAITKQQALPVGSAEPTRVRPRGRGPARAGSDPDQATAPGRVVAARCPRASMGPPLGSISPMSAIGAALFGGGTASTTERPPWPW